MTARELMDRMANELGLPADEVQLEKRFVMDLGADSLDLVEIVMMLEESLFVDIPDEDVEGCETVGDLLRAPSIAPHVEGV